MSADRLIFLLALCFMCVTSNDESDIESSCDDSGLCETHTLSAPLGSSVLLPCSFSTRNHNLVSWVAIHEMHMVQLTSKGRVKFVDPRNGRLKAFPNQGSEGNYSICIDELEKSDLGCYRCEQENDCLQVKLVAEIGGVSEEMLLVTICAGAAFIVLIVGGYFCMKCIWGCINRAPDNADNPVCPGAGAPPQEMGRVQERGEDNLVYENDDQGPAIQQGHPSRNLRNVPGVQPHPDRAQPTQSGIYPNVDQFNFERVESHRRKQRFHRELISRLRQASFSRHYYVNQSDISKQQATSAQTRNQRRGDAGKKKVEENQDYKNPIYNRSAEQLNHL
ncbi:uncharacterized protein LOC115595714 [Sparus aurata]|uniref:uncharacterized protein LOC115595714 n=1 Tax=Sparus aurata TaxID=8175 RepID=UPI0011C120D8|nr:uncharacterized protein LOC115595714 [Sparus aurata]